MAAITPAEIAFQQAHITENQGPSIVGCAIFFIVFPTIIVALRFVARFMRKLPLELDDYFTLPALVGALATLAGAGLTMIAFCDLHLCAEHLMYVSQSLRRKSAYQI
jgi:hypothetical protein